MDIDINLHDDEHRELFLNAFNRFFNGSDRRNVFKGNYKTYTLFREKIVQIFKDFYGCDANSIFFSGYTTIVANHKASFHVYVHDIRFIDETPE